MNETMNIKGRERCGLLGKGTPGKRIKGMWKADKVHGKGKLSLRTFAYMLADQPDATPPLFGKADAQKWLESK